MNSLKVIVPSWGPLSLEMQVETNCRYPIFSSIGGIELFRHIIDFYSKRLYNVEIVFVLASDAPEIVVNKDEHFNVSLSCVYIETSNSIGETILAGLRELGEFNGPVVVHMADTLVDIDGPLKIDSIYVQAREDLYRWTSVKTNANGQITVVNDRQLDVETDEQLVCVGLFSFSNCNRLAQLLDQRISNSEPETEPFFQSLEDYSRLYSMELILTRQWFDCGHIDTYYQSRLGFQNLRHFNSLVYGPSPGQVTKRSESEESFRHQVRWFKQAPDSVASFIPRIFESSDGDNPYITMELLSIPTLGDLFVRSGLSLGAWNGVVRIISQIQSLFDKLASHSSVGGQLALSVYRDKTVSRINHFLSQNENGTELAIEYSNERWTLSKVLETLEDFIFLNRLDKLDTLTPIHGDFCFSNLLFDTKLGLLKMIDPRGEFGVPGIFGDKRYDYAKLMHSYSGLYDFLVSDNFKISFSDENLINISVKTTEYHSKLALIFENNLFSDRSFFQEVKAIESLLFLSMLPLHSDKPQRQLAMLATGLQKYAKCLEEVKS